MRGSRIRERSDSCKNPVNSVVPVNINRSKNIERDYVMEKKDSCQMEHYSERCRDENKHYSRTRSGHGSRSSSRTSSRTRTRSRSRSTSRSPYRHIPHNRHYSRSRTRPYSPPRRSSRSPPCHHRISRSELSSTERISLSRKLQEENRKREMEDRLHSRPVEKYVKEHVKIMKEQAISVKEQVKAAKEQGKIAKEQFKKMIPLPEVVKKESSPSVKGSIKLPMTIRDIPNTARDMSVYSEDESEDDDPHSRIRIPQTKKEKRFKFETDIGKDIRSQLLERGMIEKKKLALENPGAAEKSFVLEALQCYSPEIHSPPTSHRIYESHNLQPKRNQKKRKITKNDFFSTVLKSSEALSRKPECFPSIPDLGFSSIEDEEKFLYGDDNDDTDNKNKFGSGDEEEEEEDGDDLYGGYSSTLQPEVKPKIKAEVISRSMVMTNIVESSDWSNSHSNLMMQNIPSKRHRLFTSDSDNNIPEYTRKEDISKPKRSPTVHHEMLERKYSASDMIDLQLPEKLWRTVTDSLSQFMKRSLSPPIKKVVEKGNKLEYASQFEVKPSLTNRRKDFLEERHPKYESPFSDFEQASNKKEKYFHSAMSSNRSKREESPPRKESRYKSRYELYEETPERKYREQTRKTDSLRSEERTRDWEESPRHRSPDRSPWKSREERKRLDREYSHSPRNLSMEQSSGHSRSPTESYYDRSPRSPSHSPRRWSTPKREIDSSRWSPRCEISPRGDDSSNGKGRDWPKIDCRDHCYDRHSPSQSSDKRQSRSPSCNKEYKSSYQQQAVQSFDSASVEAYTTSQSQQPSNISTESTDATSSYTVSQQNYYQPVYQSVNPHMTYSDYNTAPFSQTASYNAPFQSNPVPYMSVPPTGNFSSVIQIVLQPQPPRAPENVTHTNLTVIPLQSEIQKPTENKPIFATMLEEERKKHKTSKRTFVTISDSSQYENKKPPVIDVPENVTRSNLTFIPLQSEIQKAKENKPIFATMLEKERKKHETSKHTFVTISDSSQYENKKPPVIDVPENVTRSNLTFIPLQSEIQKPKENKPIFATMLEKERKKHETSKHTFVTISDSSQYENKKPPVIDVPENVTRSNLTFIPLQSEIQKPKENKPIFATMLEKERKKHETSKHTFVTISDSSQYENKKPPVIDYLKFSYKELIDKMRKKKKHLKLLQNEMAKLCKIQSEMMWKKHKEKDGHKDVLIIENTKLQEEVGNQIQESRQEFLQIIQALKKRYAEAEKGEAKLIAKNTV